ncbi:MAG TPA: hypothetical protein VD837_04105 [Terriglobales bacterium]|nr:hypothetical protein [Terriglobales bacterium]
MTSFKTVAVCIAILALCLTSVAADTPAKSIPENAKVYISPMPDGFDTFLKAAIEKKKVPLEIVEDREKAEYLITGTSETQKSGVAKKLVFLDWRSREEASITVFETKSGEVVFSYSVHKSSSNHGKQSTAEACAKHLKKSVK